MTDGDKILVALTRMTDPSKVFVVTAFITMEDLPEHDAKRGDIVAIVQRQGGFGYFHVFVFKDVTEE